MTSGRPRSQGEVGVVKCLDDGRTLPDQAIQELFPDIMTLCPGSSVG